MNKNTAADATLHIKSLPGMRTWGVYQHGKRISTHSTWDNATEAYGQLLKTEIDGIIANR